MSLLRVVSSCKHTPLTHISFSCRLSSLIFSVCVALVDLAVSFVGVSVFGLFLSITVVFGDGLPPKMIFGKYGCFFLYKLPCVRH